MAAGLEVGEVADTRVRACVWQVCRKLGARQDVKCDAGRVARCMAFIVSWDGESTHRRAFQSARDTYLYVYVCVHARARVFVCECVCVCVDV